MSIEHTISIFEYLVREASPIVPSELREELEHAREHLQSERGLSIDDVEETLIVFGKKTWAYRKAFEDLLATEETDRGDMILLTKLELPLKKKYGAFTSNGGTFVDLKEGRVSFFTPEERPLLAIALIEVREDLRHSVAQAIHSTKKKYFDERVREFERVLRDIEEQIDGLHRLADNEQEHPRLAADIRAEIRGFEYGLCLLGPGADADRVSRAEEHFVGRKIEWKVLR